MNDYDLAHHLAALGSSIVASHFGVVKSGDLKKRSDPVTIADREAEAAIVGFLKTERPTDGILAEEGSGSAARGRRWIIDPLDGTVNFIHGIPQISVSIALYEGDQPLVGVVRDVCRDEVFAASFGEGATLNGEQIEVTATDDLAHAVVGTGFPYDHHLYAEAYAANLAAVLADVNGIRRMGSAALDLAWVAAGRLDAYWELVLAPWDMAAGVLLVTEAGGRVTTPAGNPLRVGHGGAIASNDALHLSLTARVAGTLPPHLKEDQ